MKTQLFQLACMVVFLYMSCAVLLLSCNLADSEKEQFRFVIRSAGLEAHEKARVAYEAETVSVSRYDGNIPESLREQYALQSLPAVSRNRVLVSIDRHGLSQWVIEDLEPHRKIPNGKHDIPPDLSVKVKKTVIRHDQADFFDEAGRLIRSSRIDVPDMSRINGFLNYAGSETVDMKQRMTLARESGSEVLEHPNGNLTIRSRKPLSGFYVRTEAAGTAPRREVEVVELVDSRRNVIVATALYDETGEVLEETRLSYREGSRELQHIHTVSVAVDRNRVKVKHITDVYFDYLDVMIAEN